MQIKLGKKQNKLTIEGVKYKAVAMDGCLGCDLTPSQCETIKRTAAPCGPGWRDDGRSVVWVKVVKMEKDETAA